MGQKVLTYNSKLRLFPNKLKFRWFGPCVVTQVFPHGAVEVHSPQKNQTFKVNEHKVKPYIEMNFAPRDEDLALQFVQKAAFSRTQMHLPRVVVLKLLLTVWLKTLNLVLMGRKPHLISF